MRSYMLCEEVCWRWKSQEQLRVWNIVESDSKIVVSWAAGLFCPWGYLDKIDRIRHCMMAYGYSVSWAPRLANSEIDELPCQAFVLCLLPFIYFLN